MNLPTLNRPPLIRGDEFMSVHDFIAIGAHVCPDGRERGASDGCPACRAWFRRYELVLRVRRFRLTILIFFLRVRERLTAPGRA